MVLRECHRRDGRCAVDACRKSSGFEGIGVLLKVRTSPLLSRASLNRVGHITLSGSHLCDLTRKAKRGEFNLRPIIVASMRANAGPDMKTASVTFGVRTMPNAGDPAADLLLRGMRPSKTSSKASTMAWPNAMALSATLLSSLPEQP